MTLCLAYTKYRIYAMTQDSHKGAKEQRSRRATTTSRYKRLPNYLRYTYQALASTSLPARLLYGYSTEEAED
jgi:hypothetical protein